MRVAYLINQYPGISHSFVRREIEALERAGLGVARFAVRPPKTAVIAEEDLKEAKLTRHILSTGKITLAKDAARGALANPAGALGALVEAVKLGWRSEAGLLRHIIYYAEALALSAWLRDEKLAHVHAHFGTNSATVAMLAAKLAGGGFSMTVHGPEEFDKPGLIGLAAKIRDSRFSVAVSSYGVSQLRRLVAPAFWDRIRLVRCGVEDAFFAGAASPPSAAPVFVSVGRLAEQKGQMTLIEAAAILKREGRAFTVRLIGDGEMRAAIEAAIARDGLKEHVLLLGWKTPAEVRAEIEACRAFVLPSYAEGLPVSIMEAFFLGRPVISTYVAGIPELVIDGENGWLAPAADAAALADAMRAALDAAPAALAAMGEAGKTRASRLHAIDLCAADLKRLFEERAA